MRIKKSGVDTRSKPCIVCGGTDRMYYIKERGMFFCRKNSKHYEKVRNMGKMAYKEPDYDKELEKAYKTISRFNETSFIDDMPGVESYLTPEICGAKLQCMANEREPFFSESGELLGKFPCLLFKFKTAGDHLAFLHKIYINVNKGTVAKRTSKMLHQDWKTAVCQTRDNISSCCVVAEGIRNSLAASHNLLGGGCDAYALGIVSNAETFSISEYNQYIVVADTDKNFFGLKVAAQIAGRIADLYPDKPIQIATFSANSLTFIKSEKLDVFYFYNIYGAK